MKINIKKANIFYINLDKNPERKNIFEKNIKSLKLQAYRINAIDGNQLINNSYVSKISKELNIPQQKLKPEYFKNSKNFASLSHKYHILLPRVGCLLSHLKALKKAYDDNLDNILILEDDAVVFPDILNKTFEIPDNTDIFYFGGTFKHIKKTDYPDDLDIIKIDTKKLKLFGTFGFYLPNRKSIEDLFRVTRSIFLPGKSKIKSIDWRTGQVRLMAQPFDRLLINHFQTNGNCYVSNPILIYHEDYGFTNLKIKTNYNRYNMKFYLKPSHEIYLNNQINLLKEYQKFNLVYMAKPKYGGWVSFTAHLSHKTNSDIYRIVSR